MLRKLVVAALAFVALAAAQPADAQHRRHHRRRPIIEVNVQPSGYYPYGYYGRGWYEPDYFREQLDSVREIPFTIWDSHDRAMARIKWEEHMENRERELRRRAERTARYGPGRPIPAPGTPMGPYQWGYRYPFDACEYEWNSRSTCTQYADPEEWEAYWRENPKAGERYARRPQEPARPSVRQSAPPDEDVPEAIDSPVAMITVVNLTGCPASINGVPIPDEGLSVPKANRLFAEVTGACPTKHFKRVGLDRLALKCRP